MKNSNHESSKEPGQDLSPEYEAQVRNYIKALEEHSTKKGQYYVILDDRLWRDGLNKVRLFAAVRLLMQYGKSGENVPNRNERIQALNSLIQRLKPEGLNEKVQKDINEISQKTHRDSWREITKLFTNKDL